MEKVRKNFRKVEPRLVLFFQKSDRSLDWGSPETTYFLANVGVQGVNRSDKNDKKMAKIEIPEIASQQGDSRK